MSQGDGTGRMTALQRQPVRGLQPAGFGVQVQTEPFGDQQSKQLDDFVRTLNIDDDHAIVLTARTGVSTMELNRTQQTAERVLAAAGSHVPLITVPSNLTIETISRKRMAEYGWVQVADGSAGETIDVNALAETHRQQLADLGWLPPDATDQELADMMRAHPETAKDAGYIAAIDLLDSDDWVPAEDVAVRHSELD